MQYGSEVKYMENCSMYLAPTDKTKVENIITTLDSNTLGYDDMSPKLLKHTSSLISIPLTHIINLTLRTGTVPDQLNIAKLITIVKFGDRGEINNYRPIFIHSALKKRENYILKTN